MLSLSRDNRLIFLSHLVWGLGTGFYVYLWPLYVESLGASPVQIGTVFTLGGLVTTLSFIPGGMLADRYRRRRVMLAGWVMGTLAALPYLLAQTWWQVIPGTMLMCLSAFCVPATDGYVAQASEGRNLGQALTIIYSGWSLGTMITPTIGGWIAASFGMRPLFALAFLFFLLSTLLILPISERPLETRSTVQPSQVGLLRQRSLVLYMAASCFVFFALGLGSPFVPNYLKDVAGLNISWVSSLGAFNSLGAVVLSAFLGRLAAQKGDRWGLLVGEGGTFLGFLLLLGPRTPPLLALSFFLRGGFAPVGSLATAYIAELIGSQALGWGFGIFGTATNAALAIIAPFVAGWLYGLAPGLPIVIALWLAPLAMLATALVVRSKPNSHLPR